MEFIDFGEPEAQKPGRKFKDLQSRSIAHINHSSNKSKPRHSDRKKKEVLMWLALTSIPLQESLVRPGLVKPTGRMKDDGLSPVEPGFRRPTYKEAGDFFKISPNTIQGWWQRREQILHGPKKKTKPKAKPKTTRQK
ncbi:uncharacterized protein GGS25DRAFT_446043 [Hypoxylon fragiforme]|uniref:uncharacterized protein n=1 Tax=Hypoxylon fragiforme TaxID=63214 RepID=UPI0020C6A77C|nr:uncharacterized protein GGS25DRAFT_446043 [Hypoxylon fragiforme]KAI2604057.1 hypothetical protein GGS25DRAFT_446043 [Hypoxylon fragiforme]